jgi:phage protein D
MNRFQVCYQVTLGQTTYQSGRTSRLLDLHSESALTIPVNRCSLVIAAPLESAIAPADPVTVSLGYDDQTTPIFTGQVKSVRWGIDRVYIEAHSQFTALTQARFNLLYEKATAGDIVKNIAQNRLNLKTETIENGLKFPSYALGDHHSAYDHLQHLAHQCGFDLYADSSDKVVFAPYKSGQSAKFTYGLDLIGYTYNQQIPSVQGVEIYGESPASQGQGEDATSWLTKHEVKGTAGKSTGNLSRQFDATARTQATASKIAQAYLDRHPKKQCGSIKGLGNNQVQLGRSVTLVDLPTQAHNGTFKAIAVTHRLNQQQGFWTTVNWEET